RKSLNAFGQAYFEEARKIIRACAGDVRELIPSRNGAYCCGAGGGGWAMPYTVERVFHGRLKARQISESGAKLIVASCHNCRDQIMKSLNKEYDLGIKVKYLWEMVADSLILPNRNLR
ncbi:MAG: heterodisulfide reductase-related iron-sulfur binding cluster, partial [Desulforhopalus sp.]